MDSMILFRDDWRRFPGAIVDYKTTNQSFLRMASLYREMGVQNCLFPLTLFQPELQGVDPHDEDLPNEIKIKIGLECRVNFWYFIREVVRIPPVAGPKPIPYIANRGNLALSWLFLNNLDTALIQPRQTGKSVSTDCVMVWLTYIGATNTTINLLTKDHTLRTKNVERLKKIRDYLPKFLVNISNRDSDNQTDLTCRRLDNSYLTAVAQNSESAANNLGRGLTSPVFQIDEGPFIRFIGTTLPAALAAGTAAREEAKLYDRPHGNIFTTTAGKKDDRDGRYMYDMIHNGAVWSEAFLDAGNKEDLHDKVKKSCKGRKVIVNCTFSHRQLGKTDEWLYEAISVTGATGEEADRDFFNVWTSGSQSSPLSVELNEIIRESEIDPVFNEINTSNYIIRWYQTAEQLQQTMSETTLVIGLDTSDAIGRDAIAMVIIDPRDLSVVGCATINETNLLRFSQFLGGFMVQYPKTVLIPERKSSAQAIIDSLIITLVSHQIDPFKRIYNTVVDNYTERKREYMEIQTPMARRDNAFYDRWKKVFGFNTTGASRDTLYGTVLQNAAKSSSHAIHDRTLSSEIRGLVVKNGRIDHSNDSHDDFVIAWLLANWMLTHSKNLAFYGLDPRSVMREVRASGKKVDPFEAHLEDQQRQLRQEIEEIYDLLIEARDEWSVVRYEKKLMALNAKLTTSETDATSIDGLLDQARKQREEKQRKKRMEQRRLVRRP